MGSNKGEALQHYLNHFVPERSTFYFKKIKRDSDAQSTEISKEFCDAFLDLYKQLPEGKNGKLSLTYIQYSLLFSHVLSGKPIYTVEAFGNDYFLEEPFVQVSYQPQWLMDHLYSFYKELKEEAKKYMLRITEIEVEKIFLIEVKYYEELMYQVARMAMREIIYLEEFKQLKYEEKIEFRIGEFRGNSKLFYIKDKQTDQAWEEWRELLSNQSG